MSRRNHNYHASNYQNQAPTHAGMSSAGIVALLLLTVPVIMFFITYMFTSASAIDIIFNLWMLSCWGVTCGLLTLLFPVVFPVGIIATVWFYGWIDVREYIITGTICYTMFMSAIPILVYGMGDR